MGNKPGREKGVFPTEKVKESANDVLAVFNPTFAKAFGIALVDVTARKEERLPARESEAVEWQLLKPPIASEPLRCGWLTKLGDKTRNWKKRFFVATNRADNFSVYYFEREDQQDRPTKRKGVIFPCGYSVRSLKREEEIKEYGEFVICLQPRDRRRAWYLRCSSEKERNEWKSVLKYAVFKAKAPLSLDPVLRIAFTETYRRTRRNLGMWGYYSIDRPEQQQLSCLVSQRCESKVVNKLYDEVPVDSSEEKIKSQISKALDGIVTELVTNSWRDTSTRVNARRTKLEELVSRSLPAILRQRQLHLDSMRDAVAKHLRPLARDLGKPIIAPILHAFLKPLYKAHKEAISIFWFTMSEIIDNGLRENELKAFFKSLRWQNGALLAAFRKIRCLTRGQDLGDDDETEESVKLLSGLTVSLPDLIDLMMGVSLWQVEVRFEDSLKKLISWGVFSFVHAVETSRGRTPPKQCLASATRAMIHDSKLRARRDLKRLFAEVLCPPVRRQAINLPCVQEVLADSVVGLPTLRKDRGGSGAGAGAGAGAGTGGGSPLMPPLDEATAGFIDNDWLLDIVLNKVVDTLVASAIDPICDPMLARLNKLPGKFGFMAGI